MIQLPDFYRSPVDPLLDPQSRDLIQAAALLDVSEYDFMAIAYREWFGQEAGGTVLDGHFSRYMFGAPPPFWAHRLAAEVLQLDARGELLHSRFGIDPPPQPNRRDVISGVKQILFLLAVLWLIFQGLISDPGGW